MEGYGASAVFYAPPSDSSVQASWRNGAFGSALGCNAEVDLGSSNSFLSLGLAAGGFGQALQRNQPVKDVCVRAIWRPAVPRGPAWRRRVSGSPQATTRAAAPTCLVIYRDRQPTSAAAAGPPRPQRFAGNARGSGIPTLAAGAVLRSPESCDSGSICRRGSAVAFVCAREAPTRAQAPPSGRGAEARGPGGEVGERLVPGGNAAPAAHVGGFPARCAPWAQIPAGWDHLHSLEGTGT